jgi:REP element-mobilizing transposase RayT
MPNHIHGIVIIENEKIKSNTINVGMKNKKNNVITNDKNIVVTNDKNNVVTNDKNNVETNGRSSLRIPPRMKPKSISSFVSGFKSSVTTKINQLRNTPYKILWQKGFHDHIIRNENEYNKIKNYILNNPSNWENDKNNVNELL